jgi:hypothetical protein
VLQGLRTITEHGGVPLMVEKQAGAGSWAGMLCGRGDSLVDHLLMGL